MRPSPMVVALWLGAVIITVTADSSLHDESLALRRKRDNKSSLIFSVEEDGPKLNLVAEGNRRDYSLNELWNSGETELDFAGDRWLHDDYSLSYRHKPTPEPPTPEPPTPEPPTPEDCKYDSLLALVDCAGIGDALDGVTVFGPCDYAFAKFLDDTGFTVDDLCGPNVDELIEVLKYHVIDGEILAEDILGSDENMFRLTTLQGSDIKINRDELTVNGNKIVDPDAQKSPFVLHGIDGVLIPPIPEPPTPEPPTPEPPTPEKPTPEPPTPEPPTPEPPTPEKPTPEPPTPEPPTPERPTPDQPTPDQPTVPQPTGPPTDCLADTTREDYLLEVFGEITDPDTLLDLSTPQGQAFAFINEDESIDVCAYPQLEQRYSLSTLYYSTDGANWGENAGWVEDGLDHCEWYNVTCGDDNGVTKIQLEENMLLGPLPDEISALYTVDSLSLFGNNITSSIPSGIGNLTALKLLDIEGNDMTGVFFSEEILGLTELLALRGSFNAFNGSIPIEIAQLSNLRQLWVAQNEMGEELPTELGTLSSLESLFLYSNTFGGPIISQFGSLANLTQLRLYSNTFNGPIPEELYGATKLEVLRLDQNFMSGTISASLGNLVELRDLRLNDQSFTAGFTETIPADIGNLSLLRNLLLNNNKFSGEFPDTFENFVDLKFLDVSNNNFTSSIPSSLFLIPTLEMAYFSNNSFSGPIPPNYATPPNLRDLYFDGNQMTGEIPSIPPDTFTNLTELLFHRNDFSGAMPDTICALRTVPDAKLEDLWADCLGNPPQVTCESPTCCNMCFE